MIGRPEEEAPPHERLTGSEEPPSGPREGIILLLFTILTLAVSAYVLGGEERDAVDDPKEKAARGEVTGLDELSLVREANLRKALAKVSEGSYTRISTIRVAPERLNLTAENAEGERKILTIDPGFGIEEQDFGTSSGTTTVSAAEIDARGPERMARAVAERTEQPLDAIDYAAASYSTGGPQTWFLALDQGPARDRQWIAAADGSDLHRSGELPPSVQRENDRQQRLFEARMKRAAKRTERRTACLRRAGSASDASRCLQRFPP